MNVANYNQDEKIRAVATTKLSYILTSESSDPEGKVDFSNGIEDPMRMHEEWPYVKLNMGGSNLAKLKMQILAAVITGPSYDSAKLMLDKFVKLCTGQLWIVFVNPERNMYFLEFMASKVTDEKLRKAIAKAVLLLSLEPRARFNINGVLDAMDKILAKRWIDNRVLAKTAVDTIAEYADMGSRKALELLKVIARTSRFDDIRQRAERAVSECSKSYREVKYRSPEGYILHRQETRFHF